MPSERILITIRTYPNPSRRYTETVCTAGITEEGEWRRLYPVPLRYLENNQIYRTYDVITVDTKPRSDDPRPETYTPDTRTIKKEGHIKDWAGRAEWVYKGGQFNTIEAMKAADRSIGLVAVDEVQDIEFAKDSPTWSPKQLDKLRQQNLFQDNAKELEKVPWRFYLRWKDRDGNSIRSRYLAWEIYETWRRWSTEYTDVLERIRDKWIETVCSKSNDVAFFVGNYMQRPQHYAVVGIFHPPKGESNGVLWGT